MIRHLDKQSSGVSLQQLKPFEYFFSEYSPETIAYTSGVVPSQPAPPVREHASVTSLSLGWTKRPMEETYTLQMEDSLNGYGFRPVYNGRDTRFTCQGLRRNADYKFRVSKKVLEKTVNKTEFGLHQLSKDIG